MRDLFENYHIKEFIIAATLRNEDTFRTFLNACGESQSSDMDIDAQVLYSANVHRNQLIRC